MIREQNIDNVCSVDEAICIGIEGNSSEAADVTSLSSYNTDFVTVYGTWLKKKYLNFIKR